MCVQQSLLSEEKMEHVYQPIWDLVQWTSFGYEALLRIKGGVQVEQLLQQARNEGCLYEVDTMAIESSIRCFPFMNFQKQLLFINVYPSTILDDRFLPFVRELLRKYPEIKGRIVFELSETNAERELWANDALKETLQTMKSHGFFIAIDSVGESAFTFENMMNLQPDYVKLDRRFANELATNQEKQKLISLFVNYCRPKAIVLEGIEKEIDLAQAKFLRVSIAQGYLLGIPEKL
ncbi:EAL domain-containing protein (putative c-di-GMP-specific phosphodiesterase class I) [Anoxybacillus voinovskiensis]|uniref:EAL domain-containing protein (Putative c-di-GMP-specific phosphodiesterase class I) n=1 Tax=Anoxybacteroides voinovskiense TaxID=230470 RepID=A0A840DS69_9BACL|nr:EAL domain-containing protein [Anoxybacillus voinovskiensis]MBB4072389.1 EAL domain-containing protein (putative c-di-GMP-specific phosphodiesterase class I) [Anoxybacillus voinovskiensis]GGJ58261.1 hypothetical protein GCM10008982_04230 [Anoxybacillus voinovskiensis]